MLSLDKVNVHMQHVHIVLHYKRLHEIDSVCREDRPRRRAFSLIWVLDTTIFTLLMCSNTHHHVWNSSTVLSASGSRRQARLDDTPALKKREKALIATCDLKMTHHRPVLPAQDATKYFIRTRVCM